jgi:signal transduction histidine kinase
VTTSWRSGIDRRALLAAALAALLPATTALVVVHHARRSPDAAPSTGVEAATREARELSATVLSLRLASAPALSDATVAAAASGLRGVRSVELLAEGGAVVARAAPAVGAPARCPPRVLSRAVRPGLTAVVTVDDEGCSPPPSAPSPDPLKAALAPTLLAAALGVLAALALLRTRAGGSTAALITAAARVGQGDLAVRIPAGERDELDVLRVAFNEMVAELSLSRARVDYLQRIAGWQELARRLAHEIKNPLTPIQLAVQEATRRYTGDDAKYRQTLETTREIVEEEVATLRRLVGAFSEFARLPDVKPAPADLAEFVRDMASSRALLDELDPGVTVRFEPGAVEVPVRIDRIMFRRAVENLLRNAVEAMAARGGTVWVRVEEHAPEAAEAAAQAWLVIEDDGPGIPAGQREKVFDPYFTTKATGTGLGLAIVRKIALDHDGDVGLDERPGGGARFVLTLPRPQAGRRPRRSFVTFSKAGVTPPVAVPAGGG